MCRDVLLHISRFLMIGMQGNQADAHKATEAAAAEAAKQSSASGERVMWSIGHGMWLSVCIWDMMYCVERPGSILVYMCTTAYIWQHASCGLDVMAAAIHILVKGAF